MTDIAAVEGIAETYKAKLQGLGVGTVEALLERGASPKGRAEMAAATGISDKLILEWVNHADLFRIKGVAGEYADLLEAAGIDGGRRVRRRRVRPEWQFTPDWASGRLSVGCGVSH
jgi:hypothetical protein